MTATQSSETSRAVDSSRSRDPRLWINTTVTSVNELSQCPPHWIRLDRTGYRQVRWAYFSIILNFFFLGASYEVISLEKIVQFSARDRERTNKIPLVSCFSTCPFRSKMGAADLGGSEKIPRIECAFLGCYIFVSTCLHEVVPRWQKYTSLCVIWNFLRRKFCADSKPVKKKKSLIEWAAPHPFPISFPLANISSGLKIHTNLEVHTLLKIMQNFPVSMYERGTIYRFQFSFCGGRRNHDEFKLTRSLFLFLM